MKVPPSLWASLSPGAAWALISLYLYSVIGHCFISMQVQETLPLVAWNICPVSSAIAFTLVTYKRSMLARTSPVPVRAQGWVGAENGRRLWSLGGTSDALGATEEWWEQLLLGALMIAASLSTPIPSLATSLAFLGFGKDKTQPPGYPSYVFRTSCIRSSPLILQKLNEAGQFWFYFFRPMVTPNWPETYCNFVVDF